MVNKAIDKVIDYFARSINSKANLNELLWDLAQNCISRLNFEDCVIYLVDKERNKLIQKAAFGPKNPKGLIIMNPIEIPIGQGIVGSAALNGIAEIIQDTTLDSRYIIDDCMRYSELAVPIKYNSEVLGVIDSENSKKHFFTDEHLNILTIIASFAAAKIMKIKLEEELKNIAGIIPKHLPKTKSYFEEALIIKTGNRIYRLNIKDIIRVEAESNYSVIYTNSGLKIMCARTLKSFENELDPDTFIRVHKSHLVNKLYINAMSKDQVILTDNTFISVSVRKHAEVKKALIN